MDALDQYNASFLNDGSMTRPQHPPMVSSAIDLTITNAQNALNCEWSVANSTCGSDHFPIVTKMKLSCSKCIPITTKIISNKKLQQITTDEKWMGDKFQTGMEMEEFMLSLSSLVTQAEIDIPARKIIAKKPWWNADCAKALAKNFRLTRIYRRKGNQQNWELLQNSLKEFKSIVKKAKSQGWFSYCSSITRETSIAEIWKMARIFNGNSRPTFRNEDCTEWIEDFMSKHSQPTPSKQLDISALLLNRSDAFENKISIQMIQDKIQKLKKSAAGIDRISNNVLKMLPLKALEIMADGFNDIIQSTIIPESWKECKVIPLQKTGKPTNLASSKRPISIFGKVRRIFESCLLERLEKWAEKMPRHELG